MAESKSSSGSSGGNIPWAIAKFLIYGFIAFSVISPLIQEPDKRAPVACYEAYSVASFFLVDIYSVIAFKEAAQKLEFAVMLDDFRLDCIDYLDGMDWIRAYPYPEFLFGE